LSAKINIALFASGAGSNVQNIIDYFRNHDRIRVKLVVSNNAQSGAVQKAETAGIETLVMQKEQVTNGEWLVEQLRSRNIGFIVLAGYLKMIPAALTAAYHRKMINIHPALLPKHGGKGMYGRHVHEAVKSAGDTETGITIHYVSEVYDEGEIIEQKRTAVEPHDTAEHIEQKVRGLETAFFPVIIESVILQSAL
jgi:phosphoribosylglycinamide formyltransferase-1